MGDPKVAMRIVTRCANVEQFITTYHRFCAPTSCFIPSADSRDIGSEAAFSIRLVDGTLLLRGICVVLDAWATPENPFRRPGVHIGIVRLTPESRALYDKLLEAAALALAAIPSVIAPADTVKQDVRPSVIMSATAAPDDTTTPTVLPAAECEVREDSAVDAVPVESDFAEPTIRVPATASKRDRDAIATLLGIAPLARPTLPTGNAVPVPILMPAPEQTRQLVARTRLPAMAKIVRDDFRQAGMQPLVLSRDERWWLIGAIALTVVTVVILLASSYASVH